MRAPASTYEPETPKKHALDADKLTWSVRITLDKQYTIQLAIKCKFCPLPAMCMTSCGAALSMYWSNRHTCFENPATTSTPKLKSNSWGVMKRLTWKLYNSIVVKSDDIKGPKLHLAAGVSGQVHNETP